MQKKKKMNSLDIQKKNTKNIVREGAEQQEQDESEKWEEKKKMMR